MVHQFFLCVTEHVSDFPLSNSNHKPMQRGESAPVCVKNRTWYYRGISKRPVKIKGFREVLRSCFGHCQNFFGVCCLMWSVKTVSYLKSNTSRRYSRKNDWKGAWKSEAHSGSQTRTFVLYVHLSITDKHLGLTRKPQILLMVYLSSKCLDPLAEGSFTVLHIQQLVSNKNWHNCFCSLKPNWRIALLIKTPMCSLHSADDKFRRGSFWMAQILF